MARVHNEHMIFRTLRRRVTGLWQAVDPGFGGLPQIAMAFHDATTS
jgi:hypothetical protein